MPTNVKLFLALSYISLAFGTFMMIKDDIALAQASIGLSGTELALQVFGVGLPFVLVTAAGFWRQNWARIILLALFVLGLLMTIPMLRAGAMPIAVFALQTAIQAVALMLIFTGNARAWFRREAKPESVF